MTREEVIEALKNNVKMLTVDGLERDIHWFLGSIDYSSWKIKPRTITVNGIEVPEPLMVEPDEGSAVFVVCNTGFFRCFFSSDNYSREFENGAIHSTKDAAQAHYNALWAPSRLVK